jgi:hypothetical protein
MFAPHSHASARLFDVDANLLRRSLRNPLCYDAGHVVADHRKGAQWEVSKEKSR